MLIIGQGIEGYILVVFWIPEGLLVSHAERMSEWMSITVPVHVHNMYIHAKIDTAIKKIMDLNVIIKNTQRTSEDWEDQRVNTLSPLITKWRPAVKMSSMGVLKSNGKKLIKGKSYENADWCSKVMNWWMEWSVRANEWFKFNCRPMKRKPVQFLAERANKSPEYLQCTPQTVIAVKKIWILKRLFLFTVI